MSHMKMVCGAMLERSGTDYQSSEELVWCRPERRVGPQ